MHTWVVASCAALFPALFFKPALFLKVLFKWKGSVYKLIFKEMFVYLAVYFFLNMLYRTVLLDDPQSEWKQYRYAFESLKGTLEITLP